MYAEYDNCTYFGRTWEIFELQSISLKISVTYVCEDEKLACFGLQLTSVWHERGDEDGDGDEISLANWVAIFFKYKKYIYISWPSIMITTMMAMVIEITI